MPIIKVKKKSDHFLIVKKNCIEDKKISWQARGLHTYLMSKPDDWEIIIKHLIKEGPSGKDAVYAMLKELKNAGYIIVNKLTDPNTKRFSGNSYEIFDQVQMLL